MKNKQIQLKDSFFLFSGLSVLCSSVAVLCGVSVRNCIIFFLYQLCIVFIPGTAFVLLLYKNRISDCELLGFVCLAYSLGYALQIFAYFFVALSGFRKGIPLVFSLLIFFLSLLLIFSLQFRKKNIGFKRTEAVWYLLFAAFLVLVILAYCGRYIPPYKPGDSVVFHVDALYWIENAAALTKCFPPAELRMSDTVLYYHYFASAYLAFANMVTGIDVFSLGYALYPLGKCLVFFGGLYELSRVFEKDRRKQFLFLFVLMFTTGLERYSIANYVAHILTLPFGFDIAFGYAAWFLAFLIKQFYRDKYDIQICILASVFFLMCAGHKAPVALIYLLLVGILCCYWLLQKKIQKALGYGIPVLICFAVVMIVCIGVFHEQDNVVSIGGFSHVATLRASPLFQSYEKTALEHAPGINGFLSVAILYTKLMSVLVLTINPVILFLLLTGIVAIIRLKIIDILDLALLASSAFGGFMGLFNAQEGVSQLYYTLSSFIPALLFGIRHITLNRKWLPKTVCIIVILISGIQCFWFFHDSGVLKAASSGFSELTGLKEKRIETVPYSMQYADYEALVWARDNTESDSLFLTDRSVLCDLDNYMYYGTFSERQMYMEGDRYFYGTYTKERERRREIITSLYNNDIEAFDASVTDGVDYIIQTKWITPEYDGYGCTRVFETDTITIWKIDG